jgi:cold shock CspA family protein
MKFPLQIQFRDMEKSDFIYNDIWDHAEKLERFFDRITSCKVIVSAPHRHHHQGKIYHIQISLDLPGGDIFVSTDPEKNHAHEDAYVAVRDAFDATRRRLEDVVRQERGFVKERNLPSHAKVIRILYNDGYGFISTSDNREIYFHENSVLDQEFGSLKVGDEVRFSEEMGEKGPQVTSMKKVRPRSKSFST